MAAQWANKMLLRLLPTLAKDFHCIHDREPQTLATDFHSRTRRLRTTLDVEVVATSLPAKCERLVRGHVFLTNRTNFTRHDFVPLCITLFRARLWLGTRRFAFVSLQECCSILLGRSARLFSIISSQKSIHLVLMSIQLERISCSSSIRTSESIRDFCHTVGFVAGTRRTWQCDGELLSDIAWTTQFPTLLLTGFFHLEHDKEYVDADLGITARARLERTDEHLVFAVAVLLLHHEGRRPGRLHQIHGRGERLLHALPHDRRRLRAERHHAAHAAVSLFAFEIAAPTLGKVQRRE
jgi:hypothetical protein